MEMIEVEEARKKTEAKVAYLSKVCIGDNEIEPWIVISKKGTNIYIGMNQAKMFRILSVKNDIMQSLDVFLVDKIKEVLTDLSNREEKREKQLKEDLKNGIREFGGVGTDDSDIRPSRTKTDTNRFV